MNERFSAGYASGRNHLRHAWSFHALRTSWCYALMLAGWWAGCVVGADPEQADSKTMLPCEIQIDDQRGQPTACMVFLEDSAGQPVQPEGVPFWKDHFACSGRLSITLPAGRYRYAIERGPEYESVEGAWDVSPGSSGEPRRLSVRLARIVDLAEQGWYGGDLHIHRPYDQAPWLLGASDLYVGPFITWWNATNIWSPGSLPENDLRHTEDGRFYELLAGEDERGGGALLFFHLHRPIDITGASREYPASVRYLRQAKRLNPGCHVDVEKPFWRDVPLWLASGQVDSIGIAHNHLWREGVLDNEAWGRPRDVKQWPAPHGNGLWTQHLYYQVLNAGFRIPPSAGSASGVLPNPVGYNRCYVHLDDGMDYWKWWEGLRAGRVFVTNGPLLLATVNGQRAGSVLAASGELRIQGRLHSREPIRQLQVIRNGSVVKEIPVANHRDQAFDVTLPSDQPGWVLLRAITTNDQTFRFASTAPFYLVDASGQQSVDPTAVAFFLRWARERREQLTQELSGDEKEEVLAAQDSAIDFWKRRSGDQ
ncbi:hypothetical protein FYK55_26655 [Roseiconus nitratireducens]|uniref:Secreted protein n=1 Tax=Roseiconus nitratireducens TaxID=2605748 RepID=A0A5M6CTW5_9BACT|nr:CehA/McbA family metallohydrolase [Roseiconus nitratireducens]KAA5538697.1 hypothetical protein FYK55_26655 [Roseiconus nitratireducens]